mgnify:CR=1 FL=1
MKKFEYDISTPAISQAEADSKMKALISILNKLSTEELLKVAQVINNPAQLALIKAKIL